MLSRRYLLALLGITGAAQASGLAQTRIFPRRSKPTPPMPQLFVFFGTDTSRAHAKGIYRSRFDTTSGQLSEPVLAAPLNSPSWFALRRSRDRTILFSTVEGDEHSSAIAGFVVDRESGGLTLLGQVPSGGSGPTYFSVDTTAHAAFVANYGSGTVASFRVLPDGTLSQPVSRLDFHDRAVYGKPGPQADRQDGPHPHSAVVSPDNRFLLVNDLGLDNLVVLPIDLATARLGSPRVFDTRPGSGPRHLAFHPNGRWLYVVDELSSKVDHFLWNTTRGSDGQPGEAQLTDAAHTVSTLDESFHGKNTAAEIAIGASGQTLYISNRGEDSLVVFAIAGDTGALRLIQRIPCGGRTPRHFTLDPTGKWLLCSHLESNTVSVFARNEGSGQLSGPVHTVALDAPQFALFV